MQDIKAPLERRENLHSAKRPSAQATESGNRSSGCGYCGQVDR